MPNQRAVIFNFTGKVKDLPTALEQAMNEILEGIGEEQEPEISLVFEEVEEVPNCYSCEDKQNCDILNKIIFNDPMYGEYLRSIFDPRD